MSPRGKIFAGMLAGATLTVAPALISHTPWLIWNASASVPIGLYRIAPGRKIDVGDIAVVMPPEALAGFLADRRYLPRGVPLLKHVLALGGQTVCRRGAAIITHGKIYGTALEHDSEDRPLPVWQGCRVLADGEVFLMNWNVADSFDSRYFGSVPITNIVGRAVPIWTTDRISPAPDVSGEASPGKPWRLVSHHERDISMSQIGTFTRNEDGFFGNICTLTIDAKLAILPVEKSDAENAPEHRIYCDGVEIGAAWDRTGEKAGAYLSVLIDDPSFTQPIRANLFQVPTEQDVWNLHWSRPTKRDERA
ncbi:DUF736 family protein [Mesorhizobium sp. Cs1321R2N1]|uniref:DUF736 family protein n=1 Tax=Mesorhizobium sp. Cs1321R2N1 TaxID=3015174 RepID=UPI003FA5865D